jgi:uncharacterized protein
MFPVKWLAILLIRMYQALHGSFFMGCCRFQPTCSHYAVEAIQTRGLGTGLALTAYRLARCQPFCKGGWDPVPAAPSFRSATRTPPFGPGSESAAAADTTVKAPIPFPTSHI